MPTGDSPDVARILDGVGHLVDGRITTTGDRFDVDDPSCGKVFATCPAATPDLVDTAARAAEAAREEWAATPEARRREIVAAMVDALEAALPEIDAVTLRERGSAGGESHAAVAFGRHIVATPSTVETVRDEPGHRVRVTRRPIGVVAAIAPWNAPILTMADKIFTALVAGNTVVAKPSPFTPLGTLVMARAWRDIVPPGVLNVLAGGDAVGQAMVAHPAVRMISFTGSVPAGRAIAAAAAGDLKRLLLELGGNDAAIVLDDVDPRAVAPLIFAGAFTNSGQICSAIKRLYVHESVHDALVAELAAIAGRAVPAPVEEGGTFAPLITRPQFDIVCELVEDALARGGTAVTGGAPAGREGYFYPPTLITGLGPGVRLVDEEQFGPVLPIIVFRDVEDAIAQANATPLGLGGSVWSPDIERARALADRLNSGSAWVNRHPDVAPDIPFGGFGLSGLGRSWGRAGYDAYCELRAEGTRPLPG